MTSLLFVCLGNICRSPAAMAVTAKLADQAGVEVEVDSAGTVAAHPGRAPHDLSKAEAEWRGIPLDHAARRIDPGEIADVDLVLAMDHKNLADLRELAGAEQAAKIKLLRDYDPDGGGDVPDPYYDGAPAFSQMYDIIERSCAALLADISTPAD